MAEINREKWLNNLAQAMERQVFRPLGYKLPKYRVSCSWPGGGSALSRIGECWSRGCSADGTVEMMVSPKLADTMRVAGVLAHEMVHAAVGNECGHRGPFKKLATQIGLTGKMTATEEGPEFIAALEPILAKMGPYPHAQLAPVTKKKSQQRLLKLTCADPECRAHRDFLVYSNRRQVETWGMPLCPVCQGTTGIFE